MGISRISHQPLDPCKRKIMKKLCLLVCLTLGFTTSVTAEGDPEAGKAKSAVCAACHGPDGNSMIDINPNIAVMNGMAAPLSDQDIADLAAYFSSQEATPGSTPENFVEPGEALYRGGDAERGVTACIACHGPSGNGMQLAGFPDISGQHAAYTTAQLKAFRASERHNDMNGMMRDVASKLTDEDIEILANYIAGLH